MYACVSSCLLLFLRYSVNIALEYLLWETMVYFKPRLGVVRNQPVWLVENLPVILMCLMNNSCNLSVDTTVVEYVDDVMFGCFEVERMCYLVLRMCPSEVALALSRCFLIRDEVRSFQVVKVIDTLFPNQWYISVFLDCVLQ